jgi:hypothetical protein
VIALDPTGALCVLDADEGALRSRREATAVDLLEDRVRAGHLVTVEPSRVDGEPGKMARYELRGDTLEPAEELPFDAPDGRLLDAGEAVVGLRIGEGTTLFRVEAGDGEGRSWGWVTSAAARPLAGGAAVLTAGAAHAGRIRLKRATVGPEGVPEGSWEEVAPEEGGLAVFWGEGRPGYVSAREEALRIVWGGHPLDGAEIKAPGAEVHGAMWLGERRELAVLTGPEPELHLLGEGTYRAIPLGGGKLLRPTLPGHPLAHDPSRDRLWVVTHRALRGVALGAGGGAVEGACEATAVALVRRVSP